MARSIAKEGKKKFKALFEVSTDNFKAQGTWVNDDADASTYGAVNVIIADIISVKAFVINGKKGAFFSFPQTEKGGKYYSQVIPMDKDVASELSKLAEKCAKEFDALVEED